MAAMMPAMEARSMFHPMKEASPNIMMISESMVITMSAQSAGVQYLMATAIETATVATIIIRMAFLMNPSPRTGEMASTFTILSFTGKEPVMRIV